MVAQLDQARQGGLQAGAQVGALLRLHQLVVRLGQLARRLQVPHVCGHPLAQLLRRLKPHAWATRLCKSWDLYPIVLGQQT